MADVPRAAEQQRRHCVRAAIGVGSLGVLVFMTLLWVRSNQTRDVIGVRGCYGRVMRATSRYGGVELQIKDERRNRDRTRATWLAKPAAVGVFESPPFPGSDPEPFLGIAWRTHPTYGWQARLPYWLIMLVAGAVFTLAFPDWPRAIRPRSFSLRTLFIATTVAALLLGLLIALPTSGSKLLYATPEPTYDGAPALPILPPLN